MAKLMIPARELKLADAIRALDGEFGTAIVIKVDDRAVTLFRPYGTTADFSYTGGVIPYIGVEEYTLPRDGALFEVYRRRELR